MTALCSRSETSTVPPRISPFTARFIACVAFIVSTALSGVVLTTSRKALKILAFVCFLGYIGIETTSIAAAIVSIGVAIGAALQGSLSNIAGGVLMILCVMAMYITGTVASDEFGAYRQAMCMIALTFGGMVMLYRVCQPFNGYRVVLFLSMLAVAIVCYSVPQLASILYLGWDRLDWNYARVLVIVVAIEAAFPLSSALIKIMEIVMPSSTGSTKKPVNKNLQAMR